MPSTISDRLRALGVQLGARDLKTSPPSRPASLEETLGGAFVQTAHGEAFVVETRYSAGTMRGETTLQITASLEILADWASEPRLRGMSPQEIVFLDTETTGLSGGTGTYPFLIGAGRFEAEAFVLKQFFMPDPQAEIAQLDALEEFLAPAQALATFNGKAFDAPLINTRFITQGIRSPLLDLAHVDLLHLARRLWRDRLPSRTLPNLEAQILGALRSEQDIPGWLIPQIYFDYLQSGDPSPLRNVFYHNAEDVVSLAALLNHMASLLNDPLALGSRYAVDLIAVAKLFESMGDMDRAAWLYTQGLEHEDVRDERLPQAALVQALQRLALIRKRQNELGAAIQLWEQAARHRHLEAHIELAKCYEHQLKDLHAALHWTETALALLEEQEGDPIVEAPLALYQKQEWKFAVQHRLERLKKKLGEEL
jgi:hypothetical protein